MENTTLSYCIRKEDQSFYKKYIEFNSLPRQDKTFNRIFDVNIKFTEGAILLEGSKESIFNFINNFESDLKTIKINELIDKKKG